MKRLFLLIGCAFLLNGCMTANQLAAEKSFYETMVMMKAGKMQSPIVRIEVGDPRLPINLKSIEVFAPPSDEKLVQYQQKDYVQPWLNLMGVAVPWIGAWGIVKAVSDIPSGGNTTYNQSVTGTGNTATTKGAGMILNDATSVPTVVYAPDPVIVPPSYAPIP